MLLANQIDLRIIKKKNVNRYVCYMAINYANAKHRLTISMKTLSLRGKNYV